MKDKYVIISPVRNEEDYIEKTIKSVISQTIIPLEYVIVNDGSTDETTNIIERYVNEFNWIKSINRPPKEHSPGAGVVHAFYDGFNHVENTDWDFIVKLDGDLEFEQFYFEKLLNKFAANPKLGLASGTTYEPRNGKLKKDNMPEDHVRGAAKMYRKKCWEDIGGIQPVLGWDTIDELKSQVLGWETRSYKDLIIVHYKPIGFKQTNVIKREIRAGERQHYLGYLTLFALLRGLFRMLQKPYFIAGVLNIFGFLRARINKSEQIKELELIKHLKKKQWKRLKFQKKLLNRQ